MSAVIAASGVPVAKAEPCTSTAPLMLPALGAVAAALPPGRGLDEALPLIGSEPVAEPSSRRSAPEPDAAIGTLADAVPSGATCPATLALRCTTLDADAEPCTSS